MNFRRFLGPGRLSHDAVNLGRFSERCWVAAVESPQAAKIEQKRAPSPLIVSGMTRRLQLTVEVYFGDGDATLARYRIQQEGASARRILVDRRIPELIHVSVGGAPHRGL